MAGNLHQPFACNRNPWNAPAERFTGPKPYPVMDCFLPLGSRMHSARLPFLLDVTARKVQWGGLSPNLGGSSVLEVCHIWTLSRPAQRVALVGHPREPQNRSASGRFVAPFPVYPATTTPNREDPGPIQWHSNQCTRRPGSSD